MTYEIATFPCGEGSFMRWARLAGPEPSRGCVVIGLGWGEWLEKYAPIAEDWRRRGFDCVVVEWRGQGLSSRFLEDRTRSWHSSFDSLIDDFEAFFQWYFAEDPGPVLLMGHSLGAHLLLRWYVEKNPPHQLIKGLILLSLMQRVNTAPFRYAMADIITRCAILFGFSQRCAPGQRRFDPVKILFTGNRITHDEARYEAMILAMRENPMLKPGGITYGWLNAAFRSARLLETELKHGAPRGPYLVLGPENDPLVESRFMKKIADLLPHCTSQFFSGAAHELLQETDDIRKKVWAAIDNFVAKILI